MLSAFYIYLRSPESALASGPPLEEAETLAKLRNVKPSDTPTSYGVGLSDVYGPSPATSKPETQKTAVEA